MGNYISCSLATQILSKHGKAAATKVIVPSGEIKQFNVPIIAAELMVDTPNFFLVNIQSLHVGRRFSHLSADEELDIGNVYVMFPMKRLNSTVTTADMGPLFLTAAAGSASKRASGRNVRVRPAYHHQPMKFGNEGDECKRIKSWGKSLEHEAATPKLNLDDIEDFSAPEFMHRLSMSRSKKPLLDTIAEEPAVSVSSR
ncbi:uncharacterized protein LOC103961061 [Pyrus x bretschneideri]|uniref:uncharacterized protein LOC103961061 n=1 Tax=Pyrus x bretschneideri TaxID=225117 RepID=UPI002030C3A8|nr:uncharacterized protein LOC103961061 [Pyrus x bretschneideri]